jgi:hypothetical protein
MLAERKAKAKATAATGTHQNWNFDTVYNAPIDRFHEDTPFYPPDIRPSQIQ